MYSRLPEISPSSVGDLACAKRFVELRVLGNWPPRFPINAVARGSAFHQVMNSLYAARKGDTLDVADIPALAREATRRQSWPAGTVQQQETASVEKLVYSYIDSEDPEDIAATIGTETPIGFVFHYEGKPLCFIKSTLDRVLIRPDQPDVLVVREYKTSPQRIELREALLILWCARTRWPGYRYVLEYDFVDAVEGTVTREVVTTDQLKGQWKLLVDSLRRVLASESVAQPGPKCIWCHLRAECLELPAVTLAENEEVFA